jgi:putative GTP pyrophosphokinase
MIDFESWYSVTAPRYQQLVQRVKPIIETALKSEDIIYSDIQLRIKGFESFKEKIVRKKYLGPENVEDLLGCRIICYVLSDIERISNIIQENFHIHNLEDKSRNLGTSKIGYRTVHFIVSLKDSRTRLPEYSAFKDLNFEIQLRTILEHAWAKIEHGRNYKFKGNLPNKIKRPFKLLAGDLERCDNDFDRITKVIDQYSDNITSRIKKGNLNIPINSASLREYLSYKFGDIPSFKAKFVFAEACALAQYLGI